MNFGAVFGGGAIMLVCIGYAYFAYQDQKGTSDGYLTAAIAFIIGAAILGAGISP
jgi:hypothetical protein